MHYRRGFGFYAHARSSPPVSGAWNRISQICNRHMALLVRPSLFISTAYYCIILSRSLVLLPHRTVPDVAQHNQLLNHDMIWPFLLPQREFSPGLDSQFLYPSWLPSCCPYTFIYTGFSFYRDRGRGNLDLSWRISSGAPTILSILRTILTDQALFATNRLQNVPLTVRPTPQRGAWEHFSSAAKQIGNKLAYVEGKLGLAEF